jgi:hypothetical protein
MMLTSLYEHVGKEQRHGAINARETTCWKRARPSVPPCPEEGERDHAAGVCATTGSCPPYAAYLLRTCAKRVMLGDVTLVPTRPSPWPRHRKHVVGPAVVEALVWVYHLAGKLCEGRLQAAIPELLRALERSGTMVPDPLHAALLQMGPVTMDRLLRAEKVKGGNRKHCSRTTPGSLLALILGGLLPGTLSCLSRLRGGGPCEP